MMFRQIALVGIFAKPSARIDNKIFAEMRRILNTELEPQVGAFRGNLVSVKERVKKEPILRL